MNLRKYFTTFLICLLFYPLTAYAQNASIDRFSMNAGNLFVRDMNSDLPAPNEPIDFDKSPFITKGLGPNGELIAYYNFDVQPTEPAPIYVLFRMGESSPVEGQMNIINVIPGDEGYNDFWEVQKVTVPADYQANTVTSLEQINNANYNIEETTMIINCPVVPEGSTAKYRLNGESRKLTQGWYKNMTVFYFIFSEKEIMTNSMDMISTSPIYVSFNLNPGETGGGPPSGFKLEEKTGRAHNIAATLPEDNGYSPLWSVNVYDNSDFENVHDISSAQSANILATGVAIVNCPIVAYFEKIDRYSADAGNLFVRDAENGLPDPNEPIDMDQAPFITKGLGPAGEQISYYNFDVQPTEPAPIFVLFRKGESSPVDGQTNIINVIPGEEGYNDFWEVQKVTVPEDYIVNTVTGYEEIMNEGYIIEETSMIVNCPVVPEGSTALLRYSSSESTDLSEGWYNGKVIYYFNFAEKTIMTDNTDMIPTSPIYVSFNINPGEQGGGPPSGFKEDGNGRTHNVAATLPEDVAYSPLWRVNIYDNADFNNVQDLSSAQTAAILASGAAIVNCPIVEVNPAVSVREENSNLPSEYDLSQNFPNPFNPSTTIKFSIKESGKVTIKIFNAIGGQVAELVNQVLSAGNYNIVWNAENLGSGIYLYTINTNNFKASKKMILIK